MSKLTDTNKDWLLGFVSGQNFYDKKCKDSKDTETIYISRISSYCFNVGKNPDELIALKLEGLQNPATIKEFQAEELLENFLRQDKIKFLKEDKKTNKVEEEREFTESSKVGLLAAVKSFYDSTRGRSLVSDTGEFIELLRRLNTNFPPMLSPIRKDHKQCAAADPCDPITFIEALENDIQ